MDIRELRRIATIKDVDGIFPVFVDGEGTTWTWDDEPGELCRQTCGR